MASFVAVTANRAIFSSDSRSAKSDLRCRSLRSAANGDAVPMLSSKCKCSVYGGCRSHFSRSRPRCQSDEKVARERATFWFNLFVRCSVTFDYSKNFGFLRLIEILRLRSITRKISDFLDYSKNFISEAHDHCTS